MEEEWRKEADHQSQTSLSWLKMVPLGQRKDERARERRRGVHTWYAWGEYRQIQANTGKYRQVQANTFFKTTFHFTAILKYLAVQGGVGIVGPDHPALAGEGGGDGGGVEGEVHARHPGQGAPGGGGGGGGGSGGGRGGVEGEVHPGTPGRELLGVWGGEAG